MAPRIFDLLARRRAFVWALLGFLVAAGALGTVRMPIDMSFRPTFSTDRAEVQRTAAYEKLFGQVGFRDLVAIVDARGARPPAVMTALAQLAGRLRAMPFVMEVRDPTSFPFFDRDGILRAEGIAGALPADATFESSSARPLIEDLLRSPSARRVVVGDLVDDPVGDDGRTFAVTASLDIPNEGFARRRAAVAAFERTVRDWSHETGLPAQITGYPAVEQVYAVEVFRSVLRGIAILLLVMVAVLFVYFRRWSDVVTCLAGVSLSVPIVLGTMAASGQPFSIVNSQVLTLVLIVGIGQALHQQEEYRRRREAGRDHVTANREAFSILAWPSFMTGLATAAGFGALLTADMRALWSFGLSTALGVCIVYVVNWAVGPALIDLFYRGAPAEAFVEARRSGTLSAIRSADRLLRRHPAGVTLAFLAVTIALGVAGVSRLSVDQKVNEELPANHPARRAERAYESQMAGFLGPELSVRPIAVGSSMRDLTDELVRFVDRLCDMPEVRYVASPLDLMPQPLLPPGQRGKACRRGSGEMDYAIGARRGLAGPSVAALGRSVLSEDGARGAIVVRVADLGTARALPFVEQIRAAARETMPHATVEPVGQWWLAQQGMNRLSRDIMLSAVTALLVILPIMWFGIRDWKLFLAAIPPTVLPIAATLGFMGLAHITVRIGTAMILAIALGLAADDTVHLSVRIRDRVRQGCEVGSAISATLLRTGRPCSFSSYVLIAGFGSMLASSLLALRAMGEIAMFTMTFALASDVVLGPAIYLLLYRRWGKARSAVSAGENLRNLFLQTLERHPERPALTYASAEGAPSASARGRRIWRTLSWHEVAHLVVDVARALAERAPGAGTGAGTVAILADTDPRYFLLELAVGLTGGAVQPLYVSSTDDELRGALATTGADVLVVGRSQRARGAVLHPRSISLEELVRLPGIDSRSAVLPAAAEPFDVSAARAAIVALPARAPEAALLFLQSTGTTGPARVIEISERALVAAVQAVAGEASHEFPRFLSFLPTAHVSERLLTLYLSIALVGHTYFGGGLASVVDDLRACRPTVFLAPPLLLESIQIESMRAASASAVGRRLLASVRRTAEALVARSVGGESARGAGARLFGWQLRRQLGLDRVLDALAGTAPLSMSLGAWFEAVGLPVRNVYGQTELTGATSMTARPGPKLGAQIGARFGLVGRPVRGVEVRVSERQELLVRSRSAFTRYVGDESATARTLVDGWLHSGDRAEIRETGDIVLAGRVQPVVIATDGAPVDTAPMASKLKVALGDAEVVLTPVNDRGELCLYVARLSAPPRSSGASRPLKDGDPLWRRVSELVNEVDPHGVIRGWALFEDGFTQVTGEVGPTGKPRAWRIHELRSNHLRPRVGMPGDESPPSSRGVHPPS